MAALLRWSAGLLPADRRDWAYALRAEADEVPAGWRRVAWLAGGVRLTAREAALGRRLGYLLVFAAAAAGTAWSAWSGPPGDSATVIDRVDVITIALILAGLPWAIRRTCGPVAGRRLARLVRIAGYGAILALVLVKAAVERVAEAPPNDLQGTARAWTGEAVFLLVMACYAAVILGGTARRSPAGPAAVAIGTATGTGHRRGGLCPRAAGVPAALHRFMVAAPLRRGDGPGRAAGAVFARAGRAVGDPACLPAHRPAQRRGAAVAAARLPPG